MPSLGSATFKGGSGHPYRFKVFPLGTRFRKISGVYVIACRRRDENGQYRHSMVHVGQTADFSQPLMARDITNDLKEKGANCVCVQADASGSSRQEKERDLNVRFSRIHDDRPADSRENG
jgi:hypothetical protein